MKLKTLNFGRYKGVDWDHIPTNYIQYLWDNVHTLPLDQNIYIKERLNIELTQQEEEFKEKIL